ncbi:MAG: pitrilysin family protein [Burkholderiales bacterium]
MIAKKSILACGKVVFLSLFSLGAAAAIPIERWTQEGGAQVYLVQSPGIPMVDVQIDFDAGSRRDPAAKAGLAQATAGESTKGIADQGTDPSIDENSLSEAWADLGASFDASASSDRMSFSLRSLTEPELLAKAGQLAARQLGAPAFPDDVWARDRQRLAAALREADTRPATIARRAYTSALYGDHPYGFEMTQETLKRIETSDMRKFYDQTIRPCRAKVSIVGAVDRARADALAAELLSRLPSGPCEALPAIPEVKPLEHAVTRLIPFTSAQAHILMGQPGYKRDDPDHIALTVGNYILGGGGFVSQLTNEVREKRGLSYSVYSYFSPGLHVGSFTVGMQTRPDQAAQAVQVAQDVIAKFVANGPTEAELEAAKQNLIGGFALRLDSNRELLGNVANIAWHNLPLDYLDTWTAHVKALSTADVKAAIERKLHPDRMVTVVVGGQPG